MKINFLFILLLFSFLQTASSQSFMILPGKNSFEDTLKREFKNGKLFLTLSSTKADRNAVDSADASPKGFIPKSKIIEKVVSNLFISRDSLLSCLKLEDKKMASFALHIKKPETFSVRLIENSWFEAYCWDLKEDRDIFLNPELKDSLLSGKYLVVQQKNNNTDSFEVNVKNGKIEELRSIPSQGTFDGGKDPIDWIKWIKGNIIFLIFIFIAVCIVVLLTLLFLNSRNSSRADKPGIEEFSDRKETGSDKSKIEGEAYKSLLTSLEIDCKAGQFEKGTVINAIKSHYDQILKKRTAEFESQLKESRDKTQILESEKEALKKEKNELRLAESEKKEIIELAAKKLVEEKYKRMIQEVGNSDISEEKKDQITFQFLVQIAFHSVTQWMLLIDKNNIKDYERINDLLLKGEKVSNNENISVHTASDGADSLSLAIIRIMRALKMRNLDGVLIRGKKIGD